MADDYLKIFKTLIQENRLRKAPPRLFNLTTTFATGDKNPKTLLSR